MSALTYCPCCEERIPAAEADLHARTVLAPHGGPQCEACGHHSRTRAVPPPADYGGPSLDLCWCCQPDDPARAEEHWEDRLAAAARLRAEWNYEAYCDNRLAEMKEER